MRRAVVATLLLFVGALVMPPASAQTRVVEVDSFFFEDDTRGDGKIVVDKGDEILFRFGGTNEHSATVTGMFDSGVKSGGMTFTTGPLMRAGTFTLFCTEHGAQQHGSTLIVRGAGSTPSATPRPTSAKPTPTKTAPATRSAAPRTSAAAPAAVTPKPTMTVTAPRTTAPAARPTSAPKARTTAPAASTTPTLRAEAPAEEPSPVARRSLLVPGLLVLAALLLGAGGYAYLRRRPV